MIVRVCDGCGIGGQREPVVERERWWLCPGCTAALLSALMKRVGRAATEAIVKALAAKKAGP